MPREPLQRVRTKSELKETGALSAEGGTGEKTPSYCGHRNARRR